MRRRGGDSDLHIGSADLESRIIGLRRESVHVDVLLRELLEARGDSGHRIDARVKIGKVVVASAAGFGDRRNSVGGVGGGDGGIGDDCPGLIRDGSSDRTLSCQLRPCADRHHGGDNEKRHEA